MGLRIRNRTAKTFEPDGQHFEKFIGCSLIEIIEQNHTSGRGSSPGRFNSGLPDQPLLHPFRHVLARRENVHPDSQTPSNRVANDEALFMRKVQWLPLRFSSNFSENIINGQK